MPVVTTGRDAVHYEVGGTGPRALAAGMRDSRLVELSGEGHMDWFARSHDIATLTREFLDR